MFLASDRNSFRRSVSDQFGVVRSVRQDLVADKLQDDATAGWCSDCRCDGLFYYTRRTSEPSNPFLGLRTLASGRTFLLPCSPRRVDTNDLCEVWLDGSAFSLFVGGEKHKDAEP